MTQPARWLPSRVAASGPAPSSEIAGVEAMTRGGYVFKFARTTSTSKTVAPDMTESSTTILARLDAWLDRLLYNLSGMLLIVIACTVLYAVFLRYILNEPPLWAEDAPRVFFLWLTYLGVAVATRRGENIRVTHFIDKFPPLPRLIIETFMHLLVLLMLAVIFYWSFPVLELQMGGTMLSTGWSYAWSYVPLPTGCALMLLYQSRLMIRSIRAYREATSGA
jgi:TRAP-type C4-dicarboxylate transport system permease small subunit